MAREELIDENSCLEDGVQSAESCLKCAELALSCPKLTPKAKKRLEALLHVTERAERPLGKPMGLPWQQNGL